MNAMNRSIVLLLTLAVAVWTAGTPPASATELLSSRTHIFYYPWYQNLAVSGFYRHWQDEHFCSARQYQLELLPGPRRLRLGRFQARGGAADGADPAGPCRSHRLQLVGPGLPEDRYVLGTMDVADSYGIKVAWHIEPYVGRTAASVAGDIAYINSQYGRHPAFFRTLRSLARDGNKGVFYIYNSLLTTDWSPLRAVHAGNLFLAQTTDFSRVANFDGMYTYAIASGLGQGWADASAYARAHRLIWAPSIGPGYIDDRAVPGNTSPTLDRSNGATYDLEWQMALNPSYGAPYWITITSFNEWHEGTQIEAASSTPHRGSDDL